MPDEPSQSASELVPRPIGLVVVYALLGWLAVFLVRTDFAMLASGRGDNIFVLSLVWLELFVIAIAKLACLVAWLLWVHRVERCRYAARLPLMRNWFLLTRRGRRNVNPGTSTLALLSAWWAVWAAHELLALVTLGLGTALPDSEQLRMFPWWAARDIALLGMAILGPIAVVMMRRARVRAIADVLARRATPEAHSR